MKKKPKRSSAARSRCRRRAARSAWRRSARARPRRKAARRRPTASQGAWGRPCGASRRSMTPLGPRARARAARADPPDARARGRARPAVLRPNRSEPALAHGARPHERALVLRRGRCRRPTDRAARGRMPKARADSRSVLAPSRRGRRQRHRGATRATRPAPRFRPRAAVLRRAPPHPPGARYGRCVRPLPPDLEAILGRETGTGKRGGGQRRAERGRPPYWCPAAFRFSAKIIGSCRERRST